jgi:hypothetical protein
MDDDFYNYFPNDTYPDDYGSTVVLEPFVVTGTKDTGGDDGGGNDDLWFDNDFQFDDSGANALSDGDETVGGWFDSLFSGVVSALNKPATNKPASGAASSGASGGKSSSTSNTSKTSTSSVFSNTGITPALLLGVGALLLAAVWIGRNSK